jgi:deoxyribose-phosphate aldolase
MVLTPQEVEQACGICLRAGAAFVKTGTGWANRGTTLEDVSRIKVIVGDRIQIKASGGIRDLDTLVNMYRAGASRFGVNLNSGLSIMEECRSLGSGIEV